MSVNIPRRMIVTRSEKRGGSWIVTRHCGFPTGTRRMRLWTLTGVLHAIAEWTGPIKLRVAK